MARRCKTSSETTDDVPCGAGLPPQVGGTTQAQECLLYQLQLPCLAGREDWEVDAKGQCECSGAYQH